MACESIDREELLKLIYTLNNNKSPGPDNFGPILVKEMASQIIEPLLYIYNLSFSTRVLPDKLKVAKVIPIYKKGEYVLHWQLQTFPYNNEIVLSIVFQ